MGARISASFIEMDGVLFAEILFSFSRAVWPRFIKWSIDFGGASSGQFWGISISSESRRTAMDFFGEFFGA